MHICLRFVLVILILSVCCASELTRTGTGYVTQELDTVETERKGSTHFKMLFLHMLVVL